jgi:mannitol 2-dehydrogenase
MLNISRLRPDVGVPLNTATLPLHSDRLPVPTYDRSALVPSVVHIGVGGFHRAHQAAYFDDLARASGSLEWGIVGVGLHRGEMKKALVAQDCLYTLVERGVGVDRARVVGSMSAYHFAREDSAAVRAALADPRTRLVTLTVTGNGYHLDPHSGRLDTESDAIRGDLSRTDSFATAWGYLADALDQRRRCGTTPFTVVSCDNMPNNGAAAREALVSFAELGDRSLARWIADNVAFPSSMVDRITPRTSAEDREDVSRRFGVDDRWPVRTEAFSQWVIEDNFCNARPPLEDVGVELVPDVTMHKLVKTRLLNGVHCALGYLGILAGYELTAEAVGDPLIYRYVDQLMREEIAPLLPRLPGWNLDRYRRTVLTRLTNPHVVDQLSRLAARGSIKMPSYLLPSLHEAIAQRRPYSLLAFAVAAWIRYLRGYDVAGNKFVVEDESAAQLVTIAKLAQCDPRPVLQAREIFGDLGADDTFVHAVGAALYTIDRFGLTGALQRIVTAPMAGAVSE